MMNCSKDIVSVLFQFAEPLTWIEEMCMSLAPALLIHLVVLVM